MFEHEDPLAIFAALVLLWIIARFFSGEPAVHRWSARLAGATLLAYVLLQWDASSPATAGEFVGLLFSALVASAFAWALALIGFSVVFSFDKWFLGPARQRIRHAQHVRESAAEQRRQQRLTETARRSAQEQWELAAPERERARLEAEERARQARLDQKRREDARLECELIYALYAADIGSRFGRVDFDQFVKKYMRDDLTPGEVEDRGKQLRSIVQQHRDKVQPPPQFSSLSDLASWFQEQKQQAEGLLDDRLRQTVLVQLNARYAELTSQFLETPTT